VSTSLKELQSWGLIRTVRVLGDRRDHFDTSKNVWELFTRVVEERKRREMDPTLDMLREAVAELKKTTPRDKETEQRIEAMLEFFTAASAWFGKLKGLPLRKIEAIGKSGGGLWGLVKARL